MRVIHGIWAHGALCVWGEDPGLPSALRGRVRAPAPHPFACQGAELADLLAALPVPAAEAARKAAAGELTLQLPSAAGSARPLASPELDTPGAFGFLTETGPLLAGAGFGVLLPYSVRKARLGLKLTTRSLTPSGPAVTAPKFGLGDLVDFRYDVAVGDQLDDAHMRAALKFLARNQPGTMAAGDVLAAGLGSVSGRRPGSPRICGSTCTTAPTGWTRSRCPPRWPRLTW